MSTLSAQALLAGDAIQSTAMDNAIARCVQGGGTGARQFLTGLIASYSAAVSAIKTVTIKRGGTGTTGPVSTPTLAIGSTDTKVSSIAFEFAIQNVQYYKAAVAAGTALATGTIPADLWGAYIFSINAAGTIACAGAADNTTGYTTEALAIAGLPALADTVASMGYVTVLTGSGTPFVAGTDALAGGASGNPATTTNYTSTTVIYGTTTVCAIPWDFTNGPLILSLPGILKSDYGTNIGAELAASGSGGVTGTVTLFGFGA
jgi:hypothetical protein